MSLEERIAALEKEVAELRRQPDGRPTHVSVPLTAFSFMHPKFQDLDSFSDAVLRDFVTYLETEVASRLVITVDW